MAAALSDILDPRCVIPELRSRRKRDVIDELVSTLEATDKVRDARRLADEIMEREKLTSTAIGHGIAVPHRLSEEVPQTAMAIGRAPGGVKFDAPDNEPVTLVFLLVGPAGAHGTHLRLLSRLSRYLHDASFRQALLAASEAEELTRLLTEREQET
ncbi:MAG: PTS sugar transporter subunit IIA [Spirochaetaceae bacterium]